MIGVFDSGHGGLTVLRALVRELPDRAFVYLGDHAHAPYGDRAPDDIYQLTLASLERLFAQGCRLVVVACNTAAAIGLRRLQQTWLPRAHPDRRVIGVLVPMVEAITGMPWQATVEAGRHRGEPRTIAVFATRHTVESGAFVHEIGKRAPEITVVQQACPALVPLIEGAAPAEAVRAAVRGYAAELMQRLGGVVPDAALLGCTHYPLAQPCFTEALPGVEILSQPDITARSLAAYLRRHPDLDAIGARPVRFYTTGSAERVSLMASRFYGETVTFRGLAPVRPGNAPYRAAS
ncbi:Glutamate racemase [Rhodovastum atsumiense]|uniref:Glutamate racemase n=1 Tax=Rhodovastum atsumiense TaxID=504468 RepID=A0A5M6IYS8_9PROT|nr:aspartate/glutamate racemase family protein [Rhodovastum atsumiense]KAA5613496.1 glutamate racemase [Rhodovastum atsumiense]CAH2603240.1 Glutamate racemase [Rhodovastum atsumiense]